ncbi:MAG: M73 family metallopeptidase [Coriobacteriia bacterium]|nr:M73 family metallopeptidase [Coriobacteriia bacterium]
MKKAIVWACVMAIAGSVGFAGAYFTAQTSVPENIISAGTVAVTAAPDSGAISMENLAPGTPTSRVLTVTNTGSLPVDVSVTEAKRAGITEFYNALTCSVSTTGQPVYEGALAGMQTAPVRLAAGESAELEFAVTIPVEAPNTLVGDYVKITLYVDAAQAL